MKDQSMRIGVRQALTVLLDRLHAGEAFTSIVLPTRYGKSDLIRLGAFEGYRSKLVSGSLVFTPSITTTAQLIDAKRVAAMAMRYDLDIRETLARLRRLASFSEYRPFANGEVLLAANMQLAMRTNLADCLELVRYQQDATGLPLAIYLDECQFVAESQRWGQFFEAISAAGAKVIPVTATAYRADGDALLGFAREVLRTQDRGRWLVVTRPDLTKWAELWMGTESLVRMKAHHETSFEEAWGEQPSPLCHLSRETVDVPCTDDDGETRDLSTLPRTTAARLLGRVVRDVRFLEDGLRKTLRLLQSLQTINPRVAVLITTGSDQPSEMTKNAHAQQIRSLLKRLGPELLGRDLRIRVVTLKTLEDVTAADELNAFADGDEDILIVKQMGTIGFDCGRVKVLFDCSTSRTVNALIQRWMRVATPWEGFQIGYLVMAADTMADEVWRRLVIEEGGEAKLAQTEIWRPETFVKRKPVEPGPDDPVPTWLMGEARLGGYDDSHGTEGDLLYYDMATRLQRVFPAMTQSYTTPEIADGLKREQLGVPAVAAPTGTALTLDAEIQRLQTDIWLAAREKATNWMHARSDTYDQRLYQRMIIWVYSLIYPQAGLSLDTELKFVTARDTLIKLQTLLARLPDRPPTS